LGIEDWTQSPIPNPQSPIPNLIKNKFINLKIIKLNNNTSKKNLFFYLYYIIINS